MQCRISQPADEDFRRLRRAGVPVAFDHSFERASGIRIEQTGGPYESLVFDAGLQTGFEINLRVAIVSSCPLRICDVLLEGPWNELVLIQWLEQSGSVYVFPGNRCPYSAGEVLNHKLLSSALHQRGWCAEGVLLGVAMKPLPSGYRHGKSMAVTLCAVAQFGTEHSRDLQLWTDRSFRQDQTKARRPPVGTLFERDQSGTRGLDPRPHPGQIGRGLYELPEQRRDLEKRPPQSR